MTKKSQTKFVAIFAVLSSFIMLSACDNDAITKKDSSKSQGQLVASLSAAADEVVELLDGDTDNKPTAEKIKTNIGDPEDTTETTVYGKMNAAKAAKAKVKAGDNRSADESAAMKKAEDLQGFMGDAPEEESTGNHIFAMTETVAAPVAAPATKTIVDQAKALAKAVEDKPENVKKAVENLKKAAYKLARSAKTEETNALNAFATAIKKVVNATYNLAEAVNTGLGKILEAVTKVETVAKTNIEDNKELITGLGLIKKAVKDAELKSSEAQSIVTKLKTAVIAMADGMIDGKSKAEGKQHQDIIDEKGPKLDKKLKELWKAMGSQPGTPGDAGEHGDAGETKPTGIALAMQNAGPNLPKADSLEGALKAAYDNVMIVMTKAGDEVKAKLKEGTALMGDIKGTIMPKDSQDGQDSHEQDPKDGQDSHEQDPKDGQDSHEQDPKDGQDSHEQDPKDGQDSHEQDPKDGQDSHEQDPKDGQDSHEQDPKDGQDSHEQDPKDGQDSHEQDPKDGQDSHEQDPKDGQDSHEQDPKDGQDSHEQDPKDGQDSHEQDPKDGQDSHK